MELWISPLCPISICKALKGLSWRQTIFRKWGKHTRLLSDLGLNLLTLNHTKRFLKLMTTSYASSKTIYWPVVIPKMMFLKWYQWIFHKWSFSNGFTLLSHQKPRRRPLMGRQAGHTSRSPTIRSDRLLLGRQATGFIYSKKNGTGRRASGNARKVGKSRGLRAE